MWDPSRMLTPESARDTVGKTAQVTVIPQLNKQELHLA